jgi:hypothetical protein
MVRPETLEQPFRADSVLKSRHRTCIRSLNEEYIMKVIVRATMVLGLFALLVSMNVHADNSCRDEEIPVRLGDVNRDGAVTPSDGYMILDHCGKPLADVHVREGAPMPDLPAAATPNVRRLVTADVAKRDAEPCVKRVLRSPIIEIKDADTK